MDQMGTDLAEGMSESIEGNAKGNRLVLAVKEQSEIQGLQAADIPYHLWENILARLPISNLFRMLSVCTAWNSMVQSDSFLMAYKRLPCPLWFVRIYWSTRGPWFLLGVSRSLEFWRRLVYGSSMSLSSNGRKCAVCPIISSVNSVTVILITFSLLVFGARFAFTETTLQSFSCMIFWRIDGGDCPTVLFTVACVSQAGFALHWSPALTRWYNASILDNLFPIMQSPKLHSKCGLSYLHLCLPVILCDKDRDS